VFLSCLEIPQFSCLVHRTRGAQTFVGIEGHSHDFVLMARKGVKQFSAISVP
jgi:hypothetical protein